MANKIASSNARSWLFAPGDSERKMEKATAGTADIVLLDLEDAVAEGEKPKARSMVSAFLSANAKQRQRLPQLCRQFLAVPIPHSLDHSHDHNVRIKKTNGGE